MCPLLNISPLERLFVSQSVPHTQRAAKVRKFVWFSLKMLRCRARALPSLLQQFQPTTIVKVFGVISLAFRSLTWPQKLQSRSNPYPYGGGRDEREWVLCVNLNVTIPTSDYSESIWDDWFVISFTGWLGCKNSKIVHTLILIE